MITAVVSDQRGVGKTTTSVSLAAALALRGKGVLLVDLDSQASTSLPGLVLAMVDCRSLSSRDNGARIREQFRDRVFAVEIRAKTRLAEAPESGQTIFEYDASSTGAKACRLLADEFLMRAHGYSAPIMEEAAPFSG